MTIWIISNGVVGAGNGVVPKEDVVIREQRNLSFFNSLLHYLFNSHFQIRILIFFLLLLTLTHHFVLLLLIHLLIRWDLFLFRSIGARRVNADVVYIQRSQGTLVNYQRERLLSVFDRLVPVLILDKRLLLDLHGQLLLLEDLLLLYLL